MRECVNPPGPSDVTQSRGGVKMRGRCVRAFLAAMLVGGLYAAPVHAATKTFFAVLNGGQETPPVVTDAFGVAYFTFDDKALMLCYSVTFPGFRPVALHPAQAHAPAPPGPPARSPA